MTTTKKTTNVLDKDRVNPSMAQLPPPDVWKDDDNNTLGEPLRTRSVLPAQPWSQGYQKSTHRKRARMFMLFAPWGDQGLGIQAREYAKYLASFGWGVVVYSHFPSKGTARSAPKGPTLCTPKGPGTASKPMSFLQRLANAQAHSPPSGPPPLQADAHEWQLRNVHVVYSSQTREETNVAHVIQVAKSHGVTDVMLLEIRYPIMFKLAHELWASGLRVYAIPNIELVRHSELRYYNSPMFHLVLCNNITTRETLLRSGVRREKLAHFPFFLLDRPIVRPISDHRVKFLLVGGLNAFSRKQAGQVIAAFAQVVSPHTGATLTVTIQGCEAVPPALDKLARLHANITIIREHQTHGQIADLYKSHHVVVFCSRAEGIGIGLHEAMQYGCAVLAIGSPINRELVVRSMSGWTISATPRSNLSKLVGNDQMIIPCYELNATELQYMLFSLATSPLDVHVAMRTSPVLYYHYQLLAAILQRHALQIVDESSTSTEDHITTNVLQPPKVLI